MTILKEEILMELKEISESSVPSVARAKRGMEGIPATLFNGRKVVWKRVVIPAGEVAAKSCVFGENERVQALLSAEAVKDIIDTLSEFGPDKAAIGRINEAGLIEIGDGTRRRFAAIEKNVPLAVDIADLNHEEMLHLSLTGNIYRKPSVYENGLRYISLQKTLDLNNSQLEAYLSDRGEQVSRRYISRCINTAKLPLEIIQAFEVANDCSADFGEKLYRAWAAQEAGEMEQRAAKIRSSGEALQPKEIFRALLGEKKKQQAPAYEKLHKLAIAKPMKNGGTAIELSADIDDHLLAEIKHFIELTLA